MARGKQKKQAAPRRTTPYGTRRHTAAQAQQGAGDSAAANESQASAQPGATPPEGANGRPNSGPGQVFRQSGVQNIPNSTGQTAQVHGSLKMTLGLNFVIWNI